MTERDDPGVWRGFVRRLRSVPGYVRWRLVGSPLPPGPPTVDNWLAAFGDLPAPGRASALDVVVDGRTADPSQVEESLASIRSARPGSVAEVTVVSDDEEAHGHRAKRSLVEAVASAGTPAVVLVAAGTRLFPEAVAWLSDAVAGVDLAYSDHVRVGPGGEPTPVLKPAWSPRLERGSGYVGDVVAIDASWAADEGRTLDAVDVDGFVRDLASRARRVAHLPLPLWSTGRGAGPVRDPIPVATGSPTVKVIVPTRDRADLLRVSVGGLLDQTVGVDTHVVIVDNGSIEPATADHLDELAGRSDITVVRADEEFNFSRLANLGAATGPSADILLFFNNDTRVLHSGWLSRMVAWLDDPGVVGVAPRLDFPDGRIQHAGMVFGLGGDVGHYGLGHREVPVWGPPDLPREVSCLTAACLAVRAGDFERVGGFDERLPIDFQDVDLCLRLRLELGGDLVYDPTHPIVHEQMASRDPSQAGNEETMERFRDKWGSRLSEPDPYWNPHLTLERDGEHWLGEIPTRASGRLARARRRVRVTRL